MISYWDDFFKEEGLYPIQSFLCFKKEDFSGRYQIFGYTMGFNGAVRVITLADCKSKQERDLAFSMLGCHPENTYESRNSGDERILVELFIH